MTRLGVGRPLKGFLLAVLLILLMVRYSRAGELVVVGGEGLAGEDFLLLEEMVGEIEGKYLSVFKLSPSYRLTVYVCQDLQEFLKLTQARWWNGGYFHIGQQTIYLQRLEVLRERGILEQTLTHEYLHFCIWRLAGRKCPLWLNEGLVLNLSGELAGLDCPGEGGEKSVEEIERLLVGVNPGESVEGYCQAAKRVRKLIREEGLEKIRVRLERMKGI